MRYIFLILSSSFLIAQSNLLEYGDFELWQEERPAGWGFVEETDQVSAVKNIDIIYSGQAACEIVFTTQDQAVTDFVHNIIPVTAGQSYMFDARIFENDSSGRARFVIYWYDKDTVFVSRQSLGSYSKDLPEWQQLSKEIIAVEDARYAAFGFRFYDIAGSWDGDCAITIDSISVILTPTSPPEILNLSLPYFPADTQLVIRVNITDDIGVDTVLVHFFLNMDSSEIQTVIMDSVDDNTWQTIIGSQSDMTPFSYSFQVSDKDTIKHSVKNPYYNTIIGHTPLQVAGTVDDQGRLYYAGYHVCITGVVTAGTGTFAMDYHNDYLQDNSGGINLYSGDLERQIQPVNFCDSIMVWGRLFQYAGRCELLPDSIELQKSNAQEVKPIPLPGNTIDEDYEGYLVKLGEGQLHNWITEEDTSFYAQFETAAGLYMLYINRYTDIVGMINPGMVDSLIGIVSQYDDELPFTEGYYIMPRSQKDLYYSMITPVPEVTPLRTFQLFPNFPNPFNPNTTIRYTLPGETKVNLSIYDLNGRKICQLIDKKKPAGNHSVQWDGHSSHGFPAASGIYFYKLVTASGYVKTRKMILCR
jgi:DNA/RNA endonuclease YhcR with UshA esterase domain